MMARKAKRLPKPRYVDTEETLDAWVEHLSSAKVIAVDTESDSFYHYREKVCLIQMTALGQDAIIDPLALNGKLSALGPLFADPKRTKIFHDAVYDLVCLGRDFGFEFAGLFDTMLASRLVGCREFGLASLLQNSFGFEADKRLQRSNWARRPLSPEQLAYAQSDTHFLEALAEGLKDELKSKGRLHWAEEDFQRLPQVAACIPARPSEPDPNGFWRIKGVKKLAAGSRGRAKALYMMRDRLARKLDRPAFKIFGDTVLMELAQRPPEDLLEVGPRPGLGRSGVERFGAQILNALRRAKPVNGGPPPGSGRRRRSGRFLDPKARLRYEALRQLRKRQAEALGLEPEVVLGNAALEEFARKPPSKAEDVKERRPEIGGWRETYFVDDIIAAVRQ